MVEGGVFPRFDLASVDREFASTVADGAEGSSESAACGDLGELVMVADEDDLGADGACVGEDAMQVEGAAHAGFVDDDDVAARRDRRGWKSRNGVGVDASAVGEFACCPARRADTDESMPVCSKTCRTAFIV